MLYMLCYGKLYDIQFSEAASRARRGRDDAQQRVPVARFVVFNNALTSPQLFAQVLLLLGPGEGPMTPSSAFLFKCYVMSSCVFQRSAVSRFAALPAWHCPCSFPSPAFRFAVLASASFRVPHSVSRATLIDSFQTGSGQTGSSQKCGDFP